MSLNLSCEPVREICREAMSATTQWLIYRRPNPQARLRLFCFPYAGGGASIFRSWPDSLPKTVEVALVQLPGRENRLREPPFTRLAQLVKSIAPAILPHLDKPFAFFGHSMGALLGFELARELRRQRGPAPVHLFVSGRSAPPIPDKNPPTYGLPEPEFIEELRRLNGTPPEVFEYPELMELMLPIVRADFEAVQTYAYTREPPLECPITAFGGRQDEEISFEDIQAWREQTSNGFSLHMFDGDHFFLHTMQSPLLQILSRELSRIVESKL